MGLIGRSLFFKTERFMAACFPTALLNEGLPYLKSDDWLSCVSV